MYNEGTRVYNSKWGGEKTLYPTLGIRNKLRSWEHETSFHNKMTSVCVIATAQCCHTRIRNETVFVSACGRCCPSAGNVPQANSYPAREHRGNSGRCCPSAGNVPQANSYPTREHRGNSGRCCPCAATVSGSRYSDGLWARLPGFDSQQRPDRLWGSLSLLSNEDRVLFPRV
jgi:hypothetical protein